MEFEHTFEFWSKQAQKWNNGQFIYTGWIKKRIDLENMERLSSGIKQNHNYNRIMQVYLVFFTDYQMSQMMNK